MTTEEKDELIAIMDMIDELDTKLIETKLFVSDGKEDLRATVIKLREQFHAKISRLFLCWDNN